MRVLVCGDRNWQDSKYLYTILSRINQRHPISTIIEGECRGADIFGSCWAQYRDIPVEKYPANWEKYHRGAGPIRNQQMLDEGKPDLVVAFHSNIEESKGTKDMVNRAKKANVRVLVFSGPPTSKAN